MYLRNNGSRVVRFSQVHPGDPVDSGRFLVMQTWDSMEPTQGSVMGGTVITLRGNGFDRRKSYRCTYEGARNGAWGVQAQFVDATALLCTSPHANEQELGAITLTMDAHTVVGSFVFKYLPGFNFSAPTTALASGGIPVLVYAP